MKKLIILSALLAFSNTVLADDFGNDPVAQVQFNTVHQVYANFYSSENDDWMRVLGTYDLQMALSQRESYEQWFHANFEGEASTCSDTYYFAYPGQDPFSYHNGEQISYEMYSDWVLAYLANQDSFVMYQVVPENGVYKINDVRHYNDDEISESFQEQVAQYCNIGQV